MLSEEELIFTWKDEIMSCETFLLGKTVNGLAIPAYRFGGKGTKALIIGGTHGDEPEGVAAAHGLLKEFLQYFPFRLDLTIVPTLNLDGVIKGDRLNANGVDLNRNLPTKDWVGVAPKPRYFPGPHPESEPENKAICHFLRGNDIKFILSLHAWEPMVNTNGDCKGEAEIISRITGYRISDDIGYPTPGSFGTYACHELGIPTLTYEIQQEMPLDKVVDIHVPAMIEALKYTEAHR